MSLREAYAPYLDEAGWLKDSDAGASANRVLDTGTYFVQLGLSDELTKQDVLTFDRLTKLVEVPGHDGLLNRAPDNDSQQGSDDYTGWLTASLFLQHDFAHRYLRYGRQHCWFMNNERPGTLFRKHGWKPNLSAVFARYMAHIGHAWVCNRSLPPQPFRYAWARSVRNTSGYKQDSWRLSWQLVTAYEHSGLGERSMSMACHEFWKSLYKHYPGGMREVEWAYRAWPMHPFGFHFLDHGRGQRRGVTIA